MKIPYKGDWRAKEYKPYTEKLEGENNRLQQENAALREQLAMQTAVAGVQSPRPSSYWEWLHADSSLWP